MSSDAAEFTALVVCAAPLAERWPAIVAALEQSGIDVSVVLTPEASRWEGVPTPGAEHIRRGKPSVVVVAPLTFNTLNKWAQGISDNPAVGKLNGALGRGVPVVAVPLINEALWVHPALAPNLARLTAAGVRFLDVCTGQTPARPVPSGEGQDAAAKFDPAWITDALAG